MISNKIQKFIEENINLIENNEWEEVYNQAANHLGYSVTGEFTETMLKADINPVDYMDYIPDYYLNGSKISGEFTIPKGIKKIGVGAFEDCIGLKDITIPNSVTSIGNYAFSNCSSLVSVTIGDGVTSIGSYAFAHCSSLTSVTIPDSVTRISDRAFKNCSGLTNITILDSVTSIGYEAFYDCKKLKDIYYGGTKEQWQHIDTVGWIPRYRNKYIHCTDGVLIEK